MTREPYTADWDGRIIPTPAGGEPLLVGAARRMAETHPHRHIRIVSGSGTTVGSFVAEVDEWVAALTAKAKAEALREAAYHFGVIWGSGVTTEESVANVLTLWAERGVGARPDQQAPTTGEQS
jgi:hypothetical protein